MDRHLRPPPMVTRMTPTCQTCGRKRPFPLFLLPRALRLLRLPLGSRRWIHEGLSFNFRLRSWLSSLSKEGCPGGSKGSPSLSHCWPMPETLRILRRRRRLMSARGGRRAKVLMRVGLELDATRRPCFAAGICSTTTIFTNKPSRVSVPLPPCYYRARRRSSNCSVYLCSSSRRRPPPPRKNLRQGTLLNF